MIVLALDLAGNTGWCLGDSKERPIFGSIALPKTGTDVGRYLAAYHEWIVPKLKAEAPGRCVIEAPILPYKKSTVATARKLMGLAGHTEYVCHRMGVRCSEVGLQSIKLFLAGSGRADKEAMVKSARMYGFDVENHDQADAIGLWGFSVAKLCPRDCRIFSLGQLTGNWGAA